MTPLLSQNTLVGPSIVTPNMRSMYHSPSINSITISITPDIHSLYHSPSSINSVALHGSKLWPKRWCFHRVLSFRAASKNRQTVDVNKTPVWDWRVTLQPAWLASTKQCINALMPWASGALGWVHWVVLLVWHHDHRSPATQSCFWNLRSSISGSWSIEYHDAGHAVAGTWGMQRCAGPNLSDQHVVPFDTKTSWTTG